jgi:hypothetical protein
VSIPGKLIRDESKLLLDQSRLLPAPQLVFSKIMGFGNMCLDAGQTATIFDGIIGKPLLLKLYPQYLDFYVVTGTETIIPIYITGTDYSIPPGRLIVKATNTYGAQNCFGIVWELWEVEVE